MAEHAGQKRAAVKFLNRGKKVSKHRAKGRDTASDDPEDAHEVQGGIDHNIPMTIFHREDAHERAVSASASEPHLWAEHAVTTRANKGSKGRWKKRMEYKTRSLERGEKERAQTRRGDRKSCSLARTAFMLPVLLLMVYLLTRSGSSRMACVRFDSFYTESGYDKVTVRQGSSSGTNMSEFSRIYVYFSSDNIQTRNTIASACPVVEKYETPSGCFTCNSCAPSGQ